APGPKLPPTLRRRVRYETPRACREEAGTSGRPARRLANRARVLLLSGAGPPPRRQGVRGGRSPRGQRPPAASEPGVGLRMARRRQEAQDTVRRARPDELGPLSRPARRTPAGAARKDRLLGTRQV